MGERKLEKLDKTKIIDLWIIQRNVDKLKEKLKDLIGSMTDEELTLLVDAFYDHQMKEIETEFPDCIVYAIHEMADREDKELNKEEVPF